MINTGTLRRWIARLVLVVISTILAYWAAEIVYFRVMLTSTPLGKQWALHDGVRTLAQISKNGVMPHDYIALLGDSYAQGFGNWYLDVDWRQNPEFNSAHIIHNRTGVDVITFGCGGAGSLRGIVTEPITQMRYINASYLYHIEPPKVFVVYFYEGNDINNNVEHIQKNYHWRGQDRLKLPDQDSFIDFIEKEVLTTAPLNLEVNSWRPGSSLLLAGFVSKLWRSEDVRVTEREQERRDDEKKYWTGGTSHNVISLAGGSAYIPNRLQAPPVEMSEADQALGVYVFEQSLAFLKHTFPDIPVTVVYVPAPLSCYAIESPTVDIQQYFKDKRLFESALVRDRSDQLSAMIQQATERQACRYLDSRPYLRKVGLQELLHGPKDWRHFNKRGYEVLAEAVIEGGAFDGHATGEPLTRSSGPVD
jgi:hypothetical protein